LLLNHTTAAQLVTGMWLLPDAGSPRSSTTSTVPHGRRLVDRRRPPAFARQPLLNWPRSWRVRAGVPAARPPLGAGRGARARPRAARSDRPPSRRRAPGAVFLSPAPRCSPGRASRRPPLPGAARRRGLRHGDADALRQPHLPRAAGPAAALGHAGAVEPGRLRRARTTAVFSVQAVVHQRVISGVPAAADLTAVASRLRRCSPRGAARAPHRAWRDSRPPPPAGIALRALAAASFSGWVLFACSSVPGSRPGLARAPLRGSRGPPRMRAARACSSPESRNMLMLVGVLGRSAPPWPSRACPGCWSGGGGSGNGLDRASAVVLAVLTANLFHDQLPHVGEPPLRSGGAAAGEHRVRAPPPWWPRRGAVDHPPSRGRGSRSSGRSSPSTPATRPPWPAGGSGPD